MASQLQQLKTVINQVAQEANKSAANLAQTQRQFQKHSQQVQKIIGGSTQGKDKQVMQAIASASKAVQQAAQELQRASKTAQSYANSL